MELSSAKFARSGLAGANGYAQARERVEAWLRSGLEPRRLAFTLALGFAIGCLPMFGITTGICALLAFVFGLNMPAIQAANWLAMPFQALLLIPFLRMGQWLIPGARQAGDFNLFRPSAMLAQAMAAPMHVLEQTGAMLGRAMLAWGVIALPALLLLTLLLTPMLHMVRRRTATSPQSQI